MISRLAPWFQLSLALGRYESRSAAVVTRGQCHRHGVASHRSPSRTGPQRGSCGACRLCGHPCTTGSFTLEKTHPYPKARNGRCGIRAKMEIDALSLALFLVQPGCRQISWTADRTPFAAGDGRIRAVARLPPPGGIPDRLANFRITSVAQIAAGIRAQFARSIFGNNCHGRFSRTPSTAGWIGRSEPGSWAMSRSGFFMVDKPAYRNILNVDDRLSAER